MLEPRADQGESLRCHAPQASSRLITLVSQGDSATEQPLLWQLCSALQGYGYSIAVLDGTSLETERKPGLQQLLNNAFGAGHDAAEELGWSVMPAAAGLRTLARAPGMRTWIPGDTETTSRTTPAMQRVGELFRDYSVVVLYGRAELLIPVLAGSEAQPLLTLTPLRSSVMRAYRTLKQLLQQARLQPTVASLATPSQKNAEAIARNAGKTLQECAMTYLGCQTDMVTVRSVGPTGSWSDDAHRLALRLLEGAVSLNPSAVVHGHPTAALEPAF
jgi:hypothetical protein